MATAEETLQSQDSFSLNALDNNNYNSVSSSTSLLIFRRLAVKTSRTWAASVVLDRWCMWNFDGLAIIVQVASGQNKLISFNPQSSTLQQAILYFLLLFFTSYTSTYENNQHIKLWIKCINHVLSRFNSQRIEITNWNQNQCDNKYLQWQ